MARDEDIYNNGLGSRQLYNLACAYARDKQTKKALKHLKLAVDAGFKNLSSLKTDPDLTHIRSHKEFQKILTRLEKTR